MKKQQNQVNPILEKLDFSEGWDDNFYIQWLMRNSKAILSTLLILAALILIFARISSGGNKKAESDYFNAENNYAIYARGIKGNTDPAIRKEALEKLRLILDRRPDLHAKYDGLLAQALLIQGDPELASLYENRALKRTEADHLSYYANYAKNTLLIGNQHYAEALKNSILLKEEILKNAVLAREHPEQKMFGDLLFAYNLLRIAMLQNAIGSKEGELVAWKEFKGYAGLTADRPSEGLIEESAFGILLDHFQEGKVSLMNYIDYRELAPF